MANNTRQAHKPLKRGRYKPTLVPCPNCGGAGYYLSRMYPSGKAAQHKITCARCLGKKKVQPPRVKHQPDCTGCGGIYQCEGCKDWCGYCYGCLDDMPNHCDDCWCAAHPAPKRDNKKR